MIIIGWGHRTAKDFGPVRKLNCSNCNNETSWHLQKLTTWFTLFFIPLIPYQTNHLLVCPICRSCVEINKTEFEQLRDLIQNKSDAEYAGDTSQLDSTLSEAGVVRRTETQLNFIRQMKEIEMERERKNSLNNS